MKYKLFLITLSLMITGLGVMDSRSPAGMVYAAGASGMQEQEFTLADKMQIERNSKIDSPCYQFAVAELKRLLERLGVTVTVKDSSLLFKDTCYILLNFPNSGPELIGNVPQRNGISADGYIHHIIGPKAWIIATQEKGVLNGVYGLAERLGYFFLYPGEEGEWPPLKDRNTIKLPCGIECFNPRFPHRGIFNGSSDEEWAGFYAKLRMNALCQPTDPELAAKLGLRIEIGGHDLDELLPREAMADKPDMARMIQPSDFFGERVDDFNFNVTSPDAKRIIQENYRKRIHELSKDGIYAWHTWPEDLPAGGWCFDPTNRSFSASDQAMLAMRMLAEVIEEEKLPMRVPFLVYHDTLFPGPNFDPQKEIYLLYAPRERCYGHALNDPNCPNNRKHLDALRQWMHKFRNSNDAHTFEYYLDRVLFRGLYPFLPNVILEDMKVYEEEGIETHLALQVGTAFVPKLTMLNLPVFGQGMWKKDWDANDAITMVAQNILPENPQPWQQYFTDRMEFFEEAMRWEHGEHGWLDYRWLPETTTEFGAEIAKAYAWNSIALSKTADALKESVAQDWPERVKNLAAVEYGRCQFEAAELYAMHCQQTAANHIGKFLNSNDHSELELGIKMMQGTKTALSESLQKAKDVGVKAGDYYYMYNDWIQKELDWKIEHWKGELSKN